MDHTDEGQDLAPTKGVLHKLRADISAGADNWATHLATSAAQAATFAMIRLVSLDSGYRIETGTLVAPKCFA